MTDTSPIAVTAAAAERLRAVAANEGTDLGQTFLRVAVVEGGCSGLTYDLGWDTVQREGDHVVEEAGLRILLDRRSALYLDGTTLDFSEGLEGKGFHFHNPQAARTCACGESFSL
ncbi:MAG TPA: iron-sulfur cluster assembly accessory protein [Rubricoccaceae bacterium]|nr:iron-sulfur cluster assembly accessory protein [Rubricoccaceae bacterium]